MDLPLPSDTASTKGTRNWPHAPPHRLTEAGVYFLTARTKDASHLLADDTMKDWFQDKLTEIINQNDWQLEAWAVLSNHYHIVAHSPPGRSGGASGLSASIKKLHSLTTKELNRREDKPGRTRLWQNFRETHLTLQHGYLARLNYVHQNAAHHGLVRQGSDWKWCSASAFKSEVSTAWVRTIASFPYDRIARDDGE